MNRTKPRPCERTRNLLFLREPSHWPEWPFLPLVRRGTGQEEEYGVLFDAFHGEDLPGYSATVFFANVFLLPPTLTEFLALPHETYDSVEEIFDADWRID
jgi:hypothetical protein